ncbi:MAG: tyrosine-type recombinase/integrase [Nocardioides sp.]|nr:tyrosine-type recombinase/integrase [Nocardioides sp.]
MSTPVSRAGSATRRVASVSIASQQAWPPVELVFTTIVGTPVDPNNFSRTFARWCREAEVPAVRLHDLRHTCVSMLLTLGVKPRVVREIVGQSAREMTMYVYAHVAVDEQRSAVDRLLDR